MSEVFNYLEGEASVEAAMIEPLLGALHPDIAGLYKLHVEVDSANFLLAYTNQNIPTYASTVIEVVNLPKEDTWAHNKMLKAKSVAQKNDFEVPNKTALELSKKALTSIRNNSASLLFCNPTADGGILIEFTKNNTFFVLEIDNAGDIALLKRGDIDEVDDLSKDSFLQTLQLSIADA